ncbi:hypothetical protein KFK09_029211 [Dendrobium nobile]|uniref:Uncharacterized protein n=1 Tax=Dendrobium nobile TaxID=94219 RepID=A0A8T3A5M2_DENNO|nr:hypothetical protein KFK09_029211 [Dendrobium nobile]
MASIELVYKDGFTITFLASIRNFIVCFVPLREMESQPSSYHESLGSSSFGDHSSASGSSHVCPYQALHGFAHHPMHTAPLSSSDSVVENSHFHRHPTGLGGQPQAEMLNPHSFSSTDPPNHNWQHQPPPLPVPLATNSEPPTSQYGLRLSRNDMNNPQRLGSFVHAHPLPHGSISARSGSNLVAGSMAPPVLGEVRTHARGNGNHIYQQSVSSSPPPHSSPFPPIRRPRPRGVTLISTSTSTDIGGFYGFSVSTSANRSLQDSGRHFDWYYGWGEKGSLHSHGSHSMGNRGGGVPSTQTSLLNPEAFFKEEAPPMIELLRADQKMVITISGCHRLPVCRRRHHTCDP